MAEHELINLMITLQFLNEWITLSSGYNVIVEVHVIHYKVIYPMDNVIRFFNIWGQKLTNIYFPLQRKVRSNAVHLRFLITFIYL